MSKVLYIKANARPEGLSRTFQISEPFIRTYRELHPEDEIITLDLYKEGITFLPEGNLDELHRPKPGEGRDHPILRYAFQFAEVDKYVIAAPMWNLSIPAILKAYIDYVCVSGITFKYSSGGVIGLCAGRKAAYIVSRGGSYSEPPTQDLEMGDRYLRTILGFMGIRDVATIAAEPMDSSRVDNNCILQQAIADAVQLARTF